jgi:4-hydroxy-2-oxoheptanedioate aldolase
MRPSRVLRKLRAGEAVACMKLNMADAIAAEIAAIAGFDCVWTDLEHVANDWSVVQRQVWAAKAHDVDVLVRVARGGYSDYIRPLELDASGIMVPHVMSRSDAESVVRMTRFQPLGRRPLDGGNADAAYCRLDMVQYAQQANEQRFVVFQIEDPEPMDELEAIAAVEGYDMLFFGPGDFSHGIGAVGQWDHPRIVEARQRIAQLAAAHGKFAGTTGAADNVGELLAMGYRFISIGADVVALGTYCDDLLARFREQVGNDG